MKEGRNSTDERTNERLRGTTNDWFVVVGKKTPFANYDKYSFYRARLDVQHNSFQI